MKLSCIHLSIENTVPLRRVMSTKIDTLSVAAKVMNRFMATVTLGRAEVRFTGAPSVAGFRPNEFVVGYPAGKERTAAELRHHLGTKGYVSFVRWSPIWHFDHKLSFEEAINLHPRHDFHFILIGLTEEGNIWVHNDFLRFRHHEVGLTSDRFEDNTDRILNSNMTVTRRHAVESKDEMFQKVIELTRHK
jgi:hypothetical protein